MLKADNFVLTREYSKSTARKSRPFQLCCLNAILIWFLKEREMFTHLDFLAFLLAENTFQEA
jgi:hypothetical protein